MSDSPLFPRYKRYRYTPVLIPYDVPLRRIDTTLKVIIPSFKIDTERPYHLDDVFTSHVEFVSQIQAEQHEPSESFLERCKMEISAVILFFPGIHSRGLIKCLAAWLATVCTVDDILENMQPEEAEIALEESINILRGSSSKCLSPCRHNRVGNIFLAFHHVSKKHLPRDFSNSGELVNDICEFCEGQRQEFRFRQGKISTNLETYLRIRPQTMGIMPVFTMIGSLRASDREKHSEALKELKYRVCQVVGLQNDLVGLEKDLQNAEFMNAVIILAKENDGGEKTDLFNPFVEKICDLHNKCVMAAVEAWEQIQISTNGDFETEILGIDVLSFTETHLKWLLSSKRYQISEQSST